MEVQEKINHLKAVREDIGEEQFKLTAAKIFAKYVIGLMYEQCKKLSRTDLMMKINVMLRGIEVDEVSYGFVRGFI